MPDEFEDVNLSWYSFDICDVDDFFLYEDFNGYFLSSQSMGGKLDFSECAFSNSFAFITWKIPRR